MERLAERTGWIVKDRGEVRWKKIEKRNESGMTETEMESRDKVQIDQVLFWKK